MNEKNIIFTAIQGIDWVEALLGDDRIVNDNNIEQINEALTFLEYAKSSLKKIVGG